MKLSTIKKHLQTLETIAFQLPNGELVPPHFHVTEVGRVAKNFIDCGGTVRKEEVVNFQLWSADDYDHRLHPEKLLKIIELSEEMLAIPDAEIEVEYQGKETIQKFGLVLEGNVFQLTSLHTDCLAKEKCGLPEQKPKVKFSALPISNCTPGGGCC